MSLKPKAPAVRLWRALRTALGSVPEEKRIALAKRQYERELQATGHSRRMARIMAVERFGRRDE